VMDCDDVVMPCPSGMTCLYNRLLPGTRGCYNAGGDKQVRPGSCPLPATISSAGGSRCTLNSDCGNVESDQKCCASNTGSSVCQTAIPAPEKVKVTVLRNGSATGDAIKMYIATISVVQSKGKNYVFDFGGLQDTKLTLDSLRDNMGLYPEDIEAVITSHGHPDHYNNIFPTAIVVTLTGYLNSTVLVLKSTGGSTWQVNDDEDLTIMQTPGHTIQDLSLMVTNEETMGSVGLVGDMILFGGDFAILKEGEIPESYTASRKSVACVSNWIIPGHGAPFEMDDAMKAGYGC
jgi:glyoxylase-like metal-dependent hydrolase (beta-lactamase superfamily II)